MKWRELHTKTNRNSKSVTFRRQTMAHGGNYRGLS
jgi:hypothetical protein